MSLQTDIYPYEIHITVELPSDIYKFKDDCTNIGVKPIVLDFNTNSINDVMTSSKIKGTEKEAFDEIERISNELIKRNYNVVRKKLESVPWHYKAPTVENQNDDTYFECHISVIVNNETNVDNLSSISNEHKAHLSRNFFKNKGDGNYVQMLTLRNYKCIYDTFHEQVNNLSDSLKKNNISYEKVDIEYCLYDSKSSHDNAWFSKNYLNKTI